MSGGRPRLHSQTMNTTRLKQARRLFCHPGVPTSTARHNMRQWTRSVRQLGYRWLLAKPLNAVGTAK